MSKKINFNKEDKQKFSEFINNHSEKIIKHFGFVTLRDDDDERSKHDDIGELELTFLEIRVVVKIGDEKIIKSKELTHLDGIFDLSRAFEIVTKDTQKLLDEFLKFNKNSKDKDIKINYTIEDAEFNFGNRISNINSEINFDKKIQTTRKKEIGR